MEFNFITEYSTLTDIDVLVLIYNLLLMMSIYTVVIDLFKLVRPLLKKGGKFFK